MSALEPRLTRLDEQVRAALPDGPPGRRVSTIAEAVAPGIPWSVQRGTSQQLRNDVRLILRGFEHLGRARQRNGWWTGTAA